ncbi:MAG TPA: N-methyl-L-tryptophan oxidase [Planctomycetaceae bacterium]|nr:N-methyl-L-tryptophan oxidase [Planctomycetaceae bacterium]
MTSIYDAIVLGVGGFGSSALYHLARRGARVLGIEQFEVAHDRGSSHGQTRIIRQAYFEHPDYVPLLLHAYDLWRELERETGRALLNQVGLFISGLPECESVSGTIFAARTHGLPLLELSAKEAHRRFPGFHFPDEFAIVFEERAGFLAVEACVAAHVDAALRHGAELHTGEAVVSIAAEGDAVRVGTNRQNYLAQRLIITAGPWAQQVLQAGDLGLRTDSVLGPRGDWLAVVRKPIFWFPAGRQFDVDQRCSTFFFETSAGQFYGFPRIDGQSIKVAEHTQGDAVADPLTVDREMHAADLARIANFLWQHLPDVATQPVRHSVCMYTRTPDCHFIIDRHPEFAAVVLGMGFSGHGFKFTTVLGQALAELALDGATSLPVEFLSLARLQACTPPSAS